MRSRFASEVYDRASVSHALERIGLIVVIVICEAVYLAVTGLAEHPTVAGGASALFGFIVCAMLARAFFRWGIPTAEAGLEAAQRAKAYGAWRDVVMYLPFLLVIGLTFVAASVGISVVHATGSLESGARVLLAVGVGILNSRTLPSGCDLVAPWVVSPCSWHLESCYPQLRASPRLASRRG